jgi:hypothetical protein
MNGRVIKTLTNIRYRRSASTLCHNKNITHSPECDSSINLLPKSEKKPSESSVALSENYEERAAIMEFDGGLRRNDAEKAAQVFVFGHVI